MTNVEFIYELKDYLEKTNSILMSKIIDFNEDTLFEDSCNNFYGFYIPCKDSGEDSVLVLMYYEEDMNFEYPIIATVNRRTCDMGFFNYLSEKNKTDFSTNDILEAKKIIDRIMSEGLITF